MMTKIMKKNKNTKLVWKTTNKPKKKLRKKNSLICERKMWLKLISNL